MAQLDSLRAFAVIAVIAAHTLNAESWPWGKIPLGEFGVQLFFVLSGFLITRILLDCREAREPTPLGWWFPIRQFYARRFLRIFPLYYGVIAACIFLGIRGARYYSPWLLTYTFNIFLARQGHWVSYFSHFWSLAVEEQFYVVWPWIVMFCPKKWLLPAVGAMILTGPAWRTAGLVLGANHIFAYCVTPGCLDALGAGSLLAVFSRSHQKWNRMQTVLRWSTYWIVGFFLFLLVQLTRGKWGIYPLVMRTTDAFVFMALVSKAARAFSGIPGRILDLRALRYIGKISYGMYVFHPFTAAAARWLARNAGHELPYQGGITFLVATGITIAAASVSWWLYEKPLNNLKRFFPYKLAGRADSLNAQRTAASS